MQILMGRHDGLITYARWQIKKLHLHTCYKEVKVVSYVVVIDPKFEYMFMFLASFENYHPMITCKLGKEETLMTINNFSPCMI